MESIHFENDLLLLRGDISKLLSLVLDSFEMSVRALEDSDERLAMRIIRLDDPIDDLNRRIEESVYQIIARYNPLGKDLRYAITMIKFSSNLERIGDLSVNIAKKVFTLSKTDISFELPKELRQMIGIALQMIKDSFAAFGERDLEKAVEVWKRDGEVDSLERDLDNYVIENLRNEDFPKELVPGLILIARDIERIADHGTNLCEELYYIETGDDLKEILTSEEN